MRKTVWFGLLIVISIHLYGQGKETTDHFIVMFYNVENLFDTEDDPATLDDEFTPASEKQWTLKRYEKKLDDLSEVFASVDNKNLPAIIGLCEVENRQVLQDLISTRKMEKEKYGIVHEDSPDVRGIDVALIYRTDLFEMESWKKIPVNIPSDTITTRDILYVKGNAAGDEVLHCFVNHWSSRRDGEKETERRRIYASVTLRKAVDSILNFEPEAKIIIMGDFNDEPTNNSLHTFLNANNKRRNTTNRDLYNLMYDMHNLESKGTYSYKGNWNMLDQLIVSQALIHDRKGIYLDFTDGKIFSEEWMMYSNPKIGEVTPNKTYGGVSYFGGVSDHLPVYLILKKGE